MSAIEHLDSNAEWHGPENKTKKRGRANCIMGQEVGWGFLLKHMLSVTNNGCKTKGDKKTLIIMGLKGHACRHTAIVIVSLGGCCIILLLQTIRLCEVDNVVAIERFCSCGCVLLLEE